MNKKPYLLRLDEWETLLDKGPVRLRMAFFNIIVEKRYGHYSYRRVVGSMDVEIVGETLIEVFLHAHFESMQFADPLTVDADSTFVAMLQGGD